MICVICSDEYLEDGRIVCDESDKITNQNLEWVPARFRVISQTSRDEYINFVQSLGLSLDDAPRETNFYYKVIMD